MIMRKLQLRNFHPPNFVKFGLCVQKFVTWRDKKYLFCSVERSHFGHPQMWISDGHYQGDGSNMISLVESHLSAVGLLVW
jgi:hypothetical protein